MNFIFRHRRPLVWVAAALDLAIITSLIVLIVKGSG